MKKILWLMPAILLVSFSAAEAKTVDRILVQVNDEIITMSELTREVAPYRQEFETRYKGEELEEALKQVEKERLDDLIQEKLLYQKAMSLGFDASEIETHVSNYLQRLIKERNLKDMEGLEAALEKQGNTLKELRDNVRRQVVVRALVETFVSSRIALLTPEIEKYYKDHIQEFSSPEEVSISEIKISIKGDSKQAEDRANDIYRRLQQGESFPTLASQYSDALTASKGGNTGNYMLSTLNPATLKAISTMKEGDISKPQLENDCYMIYKIDTRKPVTVRPLEEVRNGISDILYQQKFNVELKRYVSQLKEEAYIQIYPEIK